MNRELAQRLRQTREDIFGTGGTDALAREIGIPAATWRNYEIGVTMPAEVLLKFIVLFGVDPNWLLTGQPPQFAKEAVGDRCRESLSSWRMPMVPRLPSAF